MKRKSKLMLTFCMLAALSAATAAGTVSALAQTGGQDATFVLRERYLLGETLSTEGATVLADGQQVRADAILYRPDGVARTGSSFCLDSIGMYTLELYADGANGRTSVRENFLVGEDVCTFADANGSYTLTAAGLNVALNEGNRVAVNQTVDITGIRADEEIVTIAVTPSVSGQADFTKITVTVTDVENPDCYIKLLLQSAPDRTTASYGLAGGTNQALTGYEKEWDRIHKNNEWGTFMPFTFYGADGASSEFGVRYDSVTKQVFALEGREIIDLDEKKYFPNQFAGFESDKVRVTVECSSYQKDTAFFTIKKLRGAPILKTFISDERAPELTVDAEDAYAVVGKQFPLFSARAVDDVSGSVPVKAKVWRNYGMTNSYLVDCLDGAFTPTEEGLYTIEYTAQDASGNVARKTAEVYANTSADEISLSLGDGAQEGTLGLPVSVRTCSTAGGSGRVVVSAAAVKDGKSTEIKEGSFIPESLGDYQIVYTATDYIGNTATESYTFHATENAEPIFDGEPFLPHYFIAGHSYTFNAIAVRDYSTGQRVDAASAIYLSQNNSRRKISAGVPIMMDFAEGNLTVIYSYENAELRKTVPVVVVQEDGKLNLGKYFRGDNVAISVNSTGTLISGTTGSRVEFIRELLAEELTARFNVGQGGIEVLRIVLTDYVDPAQTVSVRLERRGNGYAMLVNGKLACTGTGIGFTGNSASNEFTLSYQSGSISCDGISFYTIAELDPSFRGFSSGRAYLEFYFEQAGAGELLVKNINRQPTNTVNSDRIPPRIVVTGDYGGEKQIGDEIVLGGADALDVLDTKLTFTLSVTNAEGEAVTDVNGVVLNGVDGRGEYRFRIGQYGSYKVSYTARDGTGFQDGVFNYVILVEDRDAPEITFKDTMQEQYKKGTAIELPAYTLSDNVSEAENITVYRYVSTPSGQNVLLSESVSSVTATETGVYVYFIAVYDEAGNMGLARVTFTVTD